MQIQIGFFTLGGSENRLYLEISRYMPRRLINPAVASLATLSEPTPGLHGQFKVLLVPQHASAEMVPPVWRFAECCTLEMQCHKPKIRILSIRNALPWNTT